MADHEYESVRQMQGSMSQLRCADPSAFERAQYMRAVKSTQYLRTADVGGATCGPTERLGRLVPNCDSSHSRG